MVKSTIIALLSACEKVAQSINSFLKCSINISPIFDHAHPKQLEVIFTCPEFVSTFENQFAPSIRSLGTANVGVPCSQCSNPLGHTHLKVFQSTLVFINLVFFLEHAKNQSISSFCCRDTVYFKILQSDWLITFYLVSGIRFFANMGSVQDDRKQSKL